MALRPIERGLLRLSDRGVPVRFLLDAERSEAVLELPGKRHAAAAEAHKWLAEAQSPGENVMKSVERMELDAHRGQLTADVKNLVEKYRSIFEWDVPEIDEAASDQLIFGAIRRALDEVETSLAVFPTTGGRPSAGPR